MNLEGNEPIGYLPRQVQHPLRAMSTLVDLDQRGLRMIGRMYVSHVAILLCVCESYDFRIKKLVANSCLEA